MTYRQWTANDTACRLWQHVWQPAHADSSSAAVWHPAKPLLAVCEGRYVYVFLIGAPLPSGTASSALEEDAAPTCALDHASCGAETQVVCRLPVLAASRGLTG